MDRPPPPPEAVLLRRVREAAKIPVAAAARRAEMSKARWSQIEQGGARRRGVWEKAWAPPGTLAHMAAAIDLPPDRLETEGQRPDAAEVLREMRRTPREQSTAEPAPLRPDGYVPRPPDEDGFRRPQPYADPDAEAFARRLETSPETAALLHRDIDQAVQVMAQRKRMLTAEARAAELERENARLRAELHQARAAVRPERQGALPVRS